MPKGFLVKRSRKPGPMSYRMREEEVSAQATVDISPFVEIHRGYAFPSACHNNFLIRFPQRGVFGGVPQCAPSLSPTRPENGGYPYPSADAAHQMLNSTSPAPAETFPEANLGSFSANGSPAMPSLQEMTTKLDTLSGGVKTVAAKRPSSSKAKSPQIFKKRKTPTPSNQEKKPSVRDDVTTSPVLGLRITEEVEDEAKQRSTNSPLGEFVCQLCKERYADPLTLAHHKCSRIVRVEYRCDECDKVFSCPANLASHRRWHKPRSAQVERASPQGEESRPSTPTARDASPPSPPPSDSSSDEETFNCPQCSKKFRRQAYLRKHLALHNRKAASNPPSHKPSTRVPEQQHSCSPLDPSGPPTESPETSANYRGMEQPTKATGDVFPCRFCGDISFSSPGLTRHINKHHPTESRQVIVLSQTM